MIIKIDNVIANRDESTTVTRVSSLKLYYRFAIIAPELNPAHARLVEFNPSRLIQLVA